jgi:hypothetical protein
MISELEIKNAFIKFYEDEIEQEYPESDEELKAYNDAIERTKQLDDLDFKGILEVFGDWWEEIVMEHGDSEVIYSIINGGDYGENNEAAEWMNKWYWTREEEE